MISIEYRFNGKELSTLTEDEKVECRKEVDTCGLTVEGYAEVMKQTEPAKKIDVVLGVIDKNASQSMYFSDFVQLVKNTIKEVYGDE